MTAVLPGSTIGIIGGGQLARMSTMFARELGYKVIVLDPDPDCAAAAVVDRVIVGKFDDIEKAKELAAASDVVTWEIEKISLTLAKEVAHFKPLRPHYSLLELVQNKGRQKQWLQSENFAVGLFLHVLEKKDLEKAAEAFAGTAVRIKACFGGYDGRSQVRVGKATIENLQKAFSKVGAKEVIVEQEINLKAELSILVARNTNGQVVVHPAAQNWHHDAILDYSLIPAEVPEPWVGQAQSIAKRLARVLELEGILVIEFFIDDQENVFINELAPRPHNTFHTTQVACRSSQFEQHIRAVCNLPLGSSELIRPTALANLLGDIWLDGPPSKLQDVLEMPEVRLYLYGKKPRAKRKIGHLLASHESGKQALEKVSFAKQLLS